MDQPVRPDDEDGVRLLPGAVQRLPVPRSSEYPAPSSDATERGDVTSARIAVRAFGRLRPAAGRVLKPLLPRP